MNQTTQHIIDNLIAYSTIENDDGFQNLITNLLSQDVSEQYVIIKSFKNVLPHTFHRSVDMYKDCKTTSKLIQEELYKIEAVIEDAKTLALVMRNILNLKKIKAQYGENNYSQVIHNVYKLDEELNQISDDSNYILKEGKKAILSRINQYSEYIKYIQKLNVNLS